MGKRKFSNLTKDDFIDDLLDVVTKYNLPCITQREYFHFSKFSETIMRAWGFKFSDIKSGAGMGNNKGGIKVCDTLISSESSEDYENSIEYVAPIHTGKTPKCLKCDCPFPQTDKNVAVCVSCVEENKGEYNDDTYAIYLNDNGSENLLY